MLIRGVIGHEVQNELQAAAVSLRQRVIEVAKGAEQRVHVHVIRDVVAKVAHRRRVDRREPDRIDLQLGKIVEPR